MPRTLHTEIKCNLDCNTTFEAKLILKNTKNIACKVLCVVVKVLLVVVTVDVRVLVFVDDIGGAVVETGMVVVTWLLKNGQVQLLDPLQSTESRSTKNQRLNRDYPSSHNHGSVEKMGVSPIGLFPESFWGPSFHSTMIMGERGKAKNVIQKHLRVWKPTKEGNKVN